MGRIAVSFKALMVAFAVTFLSWPAMSQTASEPQTAPVSQTAPKLVVLGDSLSAGYGLPPGASFPEKLQGALDAEGVAAQVVGAGVSGDTTTGGLARLDWSVPDDADAVIVELGGNDALRGLPPAGTRANLEAIVRRVKEKGAVVLVAGMMAPPNMGADYQQEFDPIFGEIAKSEGTEFYPFFLDGVAAEPSLNLPDGIHPNAEGIDVIVRRILPSVKALLAKVPASQG